MGILSERLSLVRRANLRPAETAPTPLQPCTCTQSSIALRSANAAPGAAATLNLEVTEPNLLQPKKEPKETVKFDELKSGDPSTGDSPSSPASSTSSKKRVHFVDDAESSPSTPDFETLSVASDDSQTDIPFMSPKDRCRIRRSSILDDSNTASAMQQSRSTKTYMLRPNSEHFSPGEPRILLMLRGERALRDAKRALRDGTWREKYTESQMYRVLE